MKKGLILRVTDQKEPIPLEGVEDLLSVSKTLGVSSISVATSEDDAVRAWWHLIVHGVHRILVMKVGYNAAADRFESRGTPTWIWGEGDVFRPDHAWREAEC